MPEIKFLSNYNSIERHPKGLPASDRGGVTNDSPRQVKSRSCMKHEREGKTLLQSQIQGVVGGCAREPGAKGRE